MPDQVIKDGDVIEYCREDAGAALPFTWPDGRRSAWLFRGTMAHLPGAKTLEPEPIVAGKDIPTDICQSLVEAGMCRLRQAPAPVAQADVAVDDAPSTVKAKAGKGSDASVA